MKQIKTIFFIFLIIVSFSSCDKYLDVNDDLDHPTAETIHPSLILPAALNASYSLIANSQNDFGNVMTNQWAGDVTSFSAINIDEYNYNITSTFYDRIWEKNYIVTANLQAIINNTDGDNFNNLRAIALIMKSHNLQYIVDLYGDAPYTEAFQGGDNFQPVYDDARSIYKDLYANLEEAVELIDNADPELDFDITDFDVMLGGNMSEWKKLANTIKLKLLVRANSSTDADIVTWVSEKFIELEGSSFVDSNILINPGYAKEEDKQNPFWDTFGFDPDDNQRQTNKATVGSEYFIELLKGNGSIPTVDDRLTKYFTIAKNSTTYQGVEQGAPAPDITSIGLSYIGDGLLRAPEQDGWFFTKSESLFLQAEAALNGKLSGDAQNLFENAITESFTILGVGGSAAAYISAINTNPVDLEQIITQKWIALHGTDGGENFIEHARTGFPDFPLPIPAVDKGHTNAPYRLVYPQSEYTGNSTHVKSVSQDQIFSPSLFYQK